ncbi:MAG: 4Fe-4S binding protein [Eubacterium sp.]|nr:4Fe-4S binding protein [Eubacterium sp.]
MTPEERKKLAKRRKRNASMMHWGRIGVQILFFIFYPALFSQAFGVVKSAFASIGKGTAIDVTAFTTKFLVLCVMTIMVGRIFCGWICAFGAVGDWFYQIGQWIQKKKKKKLPAIPEKIQIFLQKTKYLILLGIILLCVTGNNDIITKNSPWTVFSMIAAGNFSVGSYGIALLLLGIIVLGMIVKERFFCQFLCPLGAVFSLLPENPLTKLKRNQEQCIPNCTLCKRNCPVALKLQENENRDGECICCGRCRVVCPKGNIKRNKVK